MAIVTVNLVDTFDQWRVKTNSLGTETGDLASLTTTDKSSIVAAINEVVTNDSDDLENIVEDITPQLGGDLDLNGKNIFTNTGVSNITVNGVVTGTNFNGAIVVESDTAPELGGNLLLGSFDITGTGNINITGGITASGAVAGATLSGAWSGNLNGDMVLNSNDITGTGNINITGSLTATSIAGTVVGVTQSASDNSTKLATTAYVDAQVETENTLVEMNDTTISATPSDGQTLSYNASTQKWVNSTPAAGGGGISLALAIAVG